MISSFCKAACSVFFAVILVAIPAYAEEPVNILGKSYPVLGVRISKSSSVRLAKIRDPRAWILEQSVYLLAGTRLLVTKRFERDRKQRQWALAITEDGLLVYVRTDGSHYIKPDPYIEEGLQYIAVSQKKFRLTSNQYGEIWITPSEIYKFKFDLGDTISIVLDRSKMGEEFRGEGIISVDIKYFSIIDLSKLKVDRLYDYFQPFNLQDALYDAFERASDFDISEDDKRAFRDLIKRRYITSKSCEEEISLEVNLSAEAAIKIDSFFSAFEAGVGVKAGVTTKTTYEKGTELEIQRYRKGEDYYELRHEEIRVKCTDLALVQRVRATESSGGKGEINTVWARELGLQVTSAGLPIYTCRDQYLDLLEVLTIDWTLSREAAVLLIAQFGRYKGSADASECLTR